jgi:hypothetical protein
MACGVGQRTCTRGWVSWRQAAPGAFGRTDCIIARCCIRRLLLVVSCPLNSLVLGPSGAGCRPCRRRRSTTTRRASSPAATGLHWAAHRMSGKQFVRPARRGGSRTAPISARQSVVPRQPWTQLTSSTSAGRLEKLLGTVPRNRRPCARETTRSILSNALRFADSSVQRSA